MKIRIITIPFILSMYMTLNFPCMARPQACKQKPYMALSSWDSAWDCVEAEVASSTWRRESEQQEQGGRVWRRKAALWNNQ